MRRLVAAIRTSIWCWIAALSAVALGTIVPIRLWVLQNWLLWILCAKVANVFIPIATTIVRWLHGDQQQKLQLQLTSSSTAAAAGPSSSAEPTSQQAAAGSAGVGDADAASCKLSPSGGSSSSMRASLRNRLQRQDSASTLFSIPTASGASGMCCCGVDDELSGCEVPPIPHHTSLKQQVQQPAPSPRHAPHQAGMLGRDRGLKGQCASTSHSSKAAPAVAAAAQAVNPYQVMLSGGMGRTGGQQMMRPVNGGGSSSGNSSSSNAARAPSAAAAAAGRNGNRPALALSYQARTRCQMASVKVRHEPADFPGTAAALVKQAAHTAMQQARAAATTTSVATQPFAAPSSGPGLVIPSHVPFRNHTPAALQYQYRPSRQYAAGQLQQGGMPAADAAGCSSRVAGRGVITPVSVLSGAPDASSSSRTSSAIGGLPPSADGGSPTPTSPLASAAASPAPAPSTPHAGLSGTSSQRLNAAVSAGAASSSTGASQQQLVSRSSKQPAGAPLAVTVQVVAVRGCVQLVASVHHVAHSLPHQPAAGRVRLSAGNLQAGLHNLTANMLGSRASSRPSSSWEEGAVVSRPPSEHELPLAEAAGAHGLDIRSYSFNCISNSGSMCSDGVMGQQQYELVPMLGNATPGLGFDGDAAMGMAAHGGVGAAGMHEQASVQDWQLACVWPPCVAATGQTQEVELLLLRVLPGDDSETMVPEAVGAAGTAAATTHPSSTAAAGVVESLAQWAATRNSTRGMGASSSMHQHDSMLGSEATLGGSHGGIAGIAGGFLPLPILTSRGSGSRSGSASRSSSSLNSSGSHSSQVVPEQVVAAAAVGDIEPAGAAAQEVAGSSSPCASTPAWAWDGVHQGPSPAESDLNSPGGALRLRSHLEDDSAQMLCSSPPSSLRSLLAGLEEGAPFFCDAREAETAETDMSLEPSMEIPDAEALLLPPVVAFSSPAGAAAVNGGAAASMLSTVEEEAGMHLEPPSLSLFNSGAHAVQRMEITPETTMEQVPHDPPPAQWLGGPPGMAASEPAAEEEEEICPPIVVPVMLGAGARVASNAHLAAGSSSLQRLRGSRDSVAVATTSSDAAAVAAAVGVGAVGVGVGSMSLMEYAAAAAAAVGLGSDADDLDVPALPSHSSHGSAGVAMHGDGSWLPEDAQQRVRVLVVDPQAGGVVVDMRAVLTESALEQGHARIRVAIPCSATSPACLHVYVLDDSPTTSGAIIAAPVLPVLPEAAARELTGFAHQQLSLAMYTQDEAAAPPATAHEQVHSGLRCWQDLLQPLLTDIGFLLAEAPPAAESNAAGHLSTSSSNSDAGMGLPADQSSTPLRVLSEGTESPVVTTSTVHLQDEATREVLAHTTYFLSSHGLADMASLLLKRHGASAPLPAPLEDTIPDMLVASLGGDDVLAAAAALMGSSPAGTRDHGNPSPVMPAGQHVMTRASFGSLVEDDEEPGQHGRPAADQVMLASTPPAAHAQAGDTVLAAESAAPSKEAAAAEEPHAPHSLFETASSHATAAAADVAAAANATAAAGVAAEDAAGRTGMADMTVVIASEPTVAAASGSSSGVATEVAAQQSVKEQQQEWWEEEVSCGASCSTCKPASAPAVANRGGSSSSSAVAPVDVAQQQVQADERARRRWYPLTGFPGAQEVLYTQALSTWYAHMDILSFAILMAMFLLVTYKLVRQSAPLQTIALLWVAATSVMGPYWVMLLNPGYYKHHREQLMLVMQALNGVMYLCFGLGLINMPWEMTFHFNHSHIIQRGLVRPVRRPMRFRTHLLATLFEALSVTPAFALYTNAGHMWRTTAITYTLSLIVGYSLDYLARKVFMDTQNQDRQSPSTARSGTSALVGPEKMAGKKACVEDVWEDDSLPTPFAAEDVPPLPPPPASPAGRAAAAATVTTAAASSGMRLRHNAA